MLLLLLMLTWDTDRVDVTDYSNNSPLHIAAQRKNIAIFQRLVVAGGDIMAFNCYDMSALQELQLSRPKLFPLNGVSALSAIGTGTSSSHGHGHGGRPLAEGFREVAMKIAAKHGHGHSNTDHTFTREERRRHDVRVHALGAELVRVFRCCFCFCFAWLQCIAICCMDGGYGSLFRFDRREAKAEK